MAEEKAPEKAKKKGGLLGKLFTFLLCIGLIVVLQVGFIFFLFALLPSLVAYFIDDSPSKHAYKTVLACNLAGMLPTLAAFSRGAASVANLQYTLANPMAWMAAYGAAAGGWLLVWMCRSAAVLLVEITCDNRIASLERTKKKMVEEWGAGIQGVER